MTGPATHRITLDPPVPDALRAELSTRVFFVSEAILDFSLHRAPDGIRGVDAVLAPSADPDEIARKLRSMVAGDVLGQRAREPKVLWRLPGSADPEDVYPELLDRGIATEAGPGQVALGEPVLSLIDRLDARLCSLAVNEFGARRYRYPTLIPLEAMRRCAYFQSFPHLMMFASRLHADVDTYRGFLDDLEGGGDLAEALRSYGGGVDDCLPPTMCFHTYHQLADRRLPGAGLAVTAVGKSFRHESRYRRSLERLWDFTIREMVFLGSRDYVLGCRARLMELVRELIQALDLGGRCEVANDPFFAAPATAERVWSQQLLELKYELRLPLEAGRDVSAGSFNFHERFFGTAFGITGEGQAVHTACAGFGLERLAYAFLCRHGLDPARWPAGMATAA